MTGRGQDRSDEGGQDKQSKGRELARQGAQKLLAPFLPSFEAIAPKHIDPNAFIAYAVEIVRRSEKLTEAMVANPESLIVTLRECAALGHMPMPGQYALVPFNDRKAPGGKAIVGVEEWRGVLQRIFRAGGVRAVKVNVGRENDQVLRFNPTRMALPEHEYDEFASPQQRGPLKAVYAWAELADGGLSQVAWLNRHDVERARASSRSGDSFWGPSWPAEGPNTEAMWRKTALHRIEGFVPSSPAYLWERAAAATASAGWQGIPDAAPAQPEFQDMDVVDATLVEDGPMRASGAGARPAGDSEGWPETAPVGGKAT